MEQYKIIIIYAISDDERKKSFETELEKYGLERVESKTSSHFP